VVTCEAREAEPADSLRQSGQQKETGIDLIPSNDFKEQAEAVITEVATVARSRTGVGGVVLAVHSSW
jgi:hypothetical protein